MSSKSMILVFLVAFILLMAIGSEIRAQFSISGTVTDPTMAPVMDVDIRLYDDAGNPLGIPQTLTDGSGFYMITGVPPATYELEFRPPSATGLVAKSVAPVVVTGNTTVNVQLELGHLLFGTVWDNSFPPVGVPDIDLNVYDQVTRVKLFTPGDNTDAVGYYEVLVPAGVYRVRWRSAVGDPWVPVEIENITVSGPTTRDITMEPGFIVDGQVVDGVGAPVVDADMDFIDEGTGLTVFTPKDNTDIDGNYMAVIPAGTYTIEVEPAVIDRLVAGDSSGVVVSLDRSVDFVLYPGVSVSGTVTDLAAIPVGDVDIDVYDNATGLKLITPSDFTDPGGHYEIIVPTGVLDFVFQPPVSSMTAPVEFIAVSVTGDMTLDAVVPDGILLSGLVEDGIGAPVVNADIDAKDPVTGASIPLTGEHTDIDGTFSLVIVPGTYDLEFEPPNVLHLAAKKLFGTVLSSDTYIPVTLESGVMISGHVFEPGGAPAFDAGIKAIITGTSDTVFAPGNRTDLLGYYEIVVVPQTYDLLFAPSLLSGITDSVLLANVPVNTDRTINVSFSTGGSNLPTANFSAGPTAGPPPLWVHFTDLSTNLPTSWSWDFAGLGTSDVQNPDFVFGDLGSYTITLTVTNADGSDQLVRTGYIVVSTGGGCCTGMVGDANLMGGDAPTIGDVSVMIDFLFISQTPVACVSEADVNQSGGVNPTGADVTIGDVSALIDHLFITSVPLPTCL